MEGDAGTSRLNPTDESSAATPEDQPDAASPQEPTEDVGESLENPADLRRPSRLGTGWAVGICAALVLFASAAIVGGYFALRANERAEAISRSDEAALLAAKDCVTATQAPDTAAMTAAQSKILECSTGDFGVQAGLFSSVIAEAYQAANASVAVDELRAAVERHNDDGSINVLVAVRVRISNAEAADQQVGYRLRATMAYDEGQYRIAKLDQVTS
ncbi:hypothetical protein [Mycolicibacterium hippocampi]|uniref:MCE associated membrane protein n=1 Tax=Mycolicibacterium hippocampi TaxID=659824 RepID=A0A850PTY1_9MYCO|nr:hypothetical protein [Mycolicibacterium hippocampi]NVN51474.1 MCE associated membrane protein [Mycolicibacterium hippocampi]